jgi:cytochrome P450
VPISSNSLDAWDPLAREEDPFATYQMLRDSAPVYRLATRDLWAIARFDDVQDAVRDWRTYSSAGGVGVVDIRRLFEPGDGNFLEQDPPRHDVLRNLIRTAFSPAQLRKRVEPAISATARSLVSAVHRRGGGDLVADLALPLPHTVVSTFVGFPSADHARLAAWVIGMHHREPGATELPAVALAAREEFRDYIGHYINLRLAEPQEDLLSLMLTGVRGGMLSIDDIKGMCTLLYFAGTGTTTQLIAETLRLLAENPAQRERLSVSTERIPAVIEEVLRYEPPVVMQARVTTRAVSVVGQAIPIGARVLLLLGSANRDERRWANPDAFDIERPLQRHLAFGDGVHHCIGAPLARLETRIALEEVLTQMPHYSVAGPLRRKWTPHEHPLTSLPISVN